MKEFRFIGSHPETLDGGRPIEPGEFTGPIDHELPQNAHLVDSGVLLEVSSGTYKKETGSAPPEAPQKLTGDALNKRAEELDIDGRSSMSADELRAAITDAEANQTPEEGQS